MRTRGHNRAGAVTLAGLAIMAVGAVTPAQAADKPTPAPATKPAPKLESRPEPKPVQDVTPPQRPTLGEANVEAGGAVSLDVQAEAGTALVVREGGEVVASASAIGMTQALSWRTTSGSHTYLVTATDAAGNASESSPVTLEVDATAPAARSFKVLPGTDRDSRSRWSVLTEAGATYTLLVDGKPVVEGTAKSRVVRDHLDLADGQHDVELQLRDSVGNLRTVGTDVTVDIPTLWVAAKSVSEPGAVEQVFKVAAPPQTRGFLRIPGAGSVKFELPDGRAEVSLPVTEGSYDAPIVIVADSLDRKGSTELEPFAVDLTAPALEVTTNDEAAERGILSAVITADEGDTITWRLVDDNGLASLSGEYVADGNAQVLERDVAEGNYELEVMATDAGGNTSAETVTKRVAANPLVNPDVVPALSIALALWVLVGLVVFLRRRGRRVAAALGRLAGKGTGRRTRRAAQLAEHRLAVEEYEDALEIFELQDQAWQQRREDLAQLIAVAQGEKVQLPDTAVELRLDERVYCAIPAALVEMQVRDEVEVPVEVDAGQLLITDERVAFVGTTSRDWELEDIESVRHLDNDRTMIKVAGQQAVSGVAYAEDDLVRLYLELAIAELKGSTRSVVTMFKLGLRQHELRRPQPPTPVVPAQQKAAESVQSVQSVQSVDPLVEAPAEATQAAAAFVGEQVKPGAVADDTTRELVLHKS